MESVKKACNKLRLGDHTAGDHTVSDDSDGDLPGITDNAAFNHDALPEAARDGDNRSKRQKVKDKAKAIVHATAHPQRAAKEKATAQIVGNSRPWLEDQAEEDERLFAAHDALDEAAGRDTHDLWQNATAQILSHAEQQDPDEEAAEKRIQHIEGEREEMQIAWHMSRYVTRVRAVRKPLAYPPLERYKHFDKDGKYAGLNWVKWIGHLSLYGFQDASLHYIDPTNAVPYDRDVLIRRIERLLIASESFQLWWMRVRHVYTWADPWLTFKWLLLFLFMLKTGYFMSCYWAYLLYSVVTNFHGKHSRHWMRESHSRTARTGQRAHMLSELIIRHGSDAWVEPFLDEFGPWIQLQVGDIADFMEVSANYYDWRNVSSTTCTCFNYVCLFLISAVPDLQYSIKVFWLSCGLFFFLSRPIGSRYPRFRHVVDPVRWMYWDSPTMAEAGIMYLRRQAGRALGKKPGSMVNLVEDDVEAEEEDDKEEVWFDCYDVSLAGRKAAKRNAVRDTEDKALLSFQARWSGRRGRLQLTRSSLRFVSTRSVGHLSDTGSVLWQHPFSELLEIRKATPPPSTNIPGANKFLGPGAEKQIMPNQKKAALSVIFAPLDEERLASTEEQPLDQLLGEEGRGEEEFLYGMEERTLNEAFNAIVGISGVLWMALQHEPGEQTRMH